MLAFQDFVPKQIRAPRLSFNVADLHGEYESFDAALAAAHAWVEENQVRVINVETVVLPNLWSPYEEGSRDPAIIANDGATFHQFIRVWYDPGAGPR